MEEIWWRQVTNARKFREEIQDEIFDLHSIVIQIPEKLQWYEEMQEMVREELHNRESERLLERIDDSGESMEPGELVLRRYCKEERQADYRPSKTHGQFLAGCPDIVLNTRYIWVSNLSYERYRSWLKFLAEYERSVKSKSKGVFILEVNEAVGALRKERGIHNIVWKDMVGRYDITMFALLLLSEWKKPDIYKQYVAELASALSADNARLCGALSAARLELAENPQQCLEKQCEKLDFPPPPAETSAKAVWEVQLKVLFPITEQFRQQFTGRYGSQIERLLPLQAVYGEVFDEPGTVELGTLKYLCDLGKLVVTGEDLRRLVLFHKTRNILAHLQTVDYTEERKAEASYVSRISI